MPSRSPLLCLTLLALALVLRLGVMLAAPERLTTDRDLYLGIASEIRAGDGFATPESDPPRPTAFRPPLYPLLLTVTGKSPVGIGGVHLLLGLVMVIATGATAARLAGDDPVIIQRTRLIAGGIVALDPMLLLYCGQPMTETLCSCLTAVILVVLTAGQGSDESAGRGAVIAERKTTLGVLWGLCVLARPTYLAPFGLWILGRVVFGRGVGESYRSRIRDVFVVGGVALAVVAPWGVRNWIVLGKPIFTTTHGGYTLWLANNPVYYAEVIEGPDAVWRGESLDQWQKATDTEMAQRGIQGEVARDEWQNQHAHEFIRSSPWRFVRACLYRARTFWSIWPGRSAESGLPVPMLWVIAGGYAALWVGGILATLRTMKMGQWRDLTPAACLIVGFAAVHLVYWTDPRMRAPIIPAVAVIVAVGLSRRAMSPSPPVTTPPLG